MQCGDSVHLTGKQIPVETPAGEISVTMGYKEDEFSATITMPAPKFDRRDIPATGEGEYKEKIGDYDVYAVNTGVPHAVIFVEAIDSVDVAAVAPAIRRHLSFPSGANVNFVQ
jgi:diaminopimelate epimerase